MAKVAETMRVAEGNALRNAGNQINRQGDSRHPARIDAVAPQPKAAHWFRCFRHFVVHGGIIDLHDLTIDIHAIRHVNHILENFAHNFGNGGFAVACGPINQNRAAGINRRAKAADETICHHQATEGIV